MTTDKIVPFYKLTKKEKKHLRENGVATLSVFKDLRVNQLKNLAADVAKKGEYHPGSMEPCWECKMIARRLGLETQESQAQVIEDALNPKDVLPVKQFPSIKDGYIGVAMNAITKTQWYTEYSDTYGAALAKATKLMNSKSHIEKNNRVTFVVDRKYVVVD